MKKSIRMSYTLASIICTVLLIGLLVANIYPCGYWGKAQLYEDEGFAGYGYHSLVEVLGNGFFWEADDVPVPNTQYRGNTSAGYYVMGQWWISLFYIPMFIAIFYLGWLIAGGRERFFRLWERPGISTPVLEINDP